MKPLNNYHRFFPLLLFFIIGSLTVRCAPDPEAMQATAAYQIAQAVTETLIASRDPTPYPTPTAYHTAAPYATHTPYPTATPI